MKYVYKYAALILALLLCLTALWGCGKEEPEAEQNNETQQDQEQGGQEDPTPQLLSDTISCSNGETTLRFERNEQGTWSWKEDSTFPLDNTYVQDLLATAEQMLALQPITTDKTLEDLGLDSEEKYVTATDEKGNRATWYLGDKDDNGCYYMRVDGDETGAVYLAPQQLHEQISRSIYDMMLLPKMPTIIAENIRSITFTVGEKTITTVPNSSGVWVVGISSVNEKVQPIVQALTQLQLDGCVDYHPSSDAPAICGFDETAPVMTLEYASEVGLESTLVLTIGNARSNGYCATVGEDTTIYLVSAELVDPILSFIQ